MTDQTRLTGLDAMIESLAKLQNRVAQINATVDAHTEVLTLARDCAGMQQGTIAAIGASVGDIVGKLRTLDANDVAIQTELLRHRGELALLAGALAVVIPRRALN